MVMIIWSTYLMSSCCALLVWINSFKLRTTWMLILYILIIINTCSRRQSRGLFTRCHLSKIQFKNTHPLRKTATNHLSQDKSSKGKSINLIFVSILKVSARRPKPLLLLSGRNHQKLLCVFPVMNNSLIFI